MSLARSWYNSWGTMNQLNRRGIENYPRKEYLGISSALACTGPWEGTQTEALQPHQKGPCVHVCGDPSHLCTTHSLYH